MKEERSLWQERVQPPSGNPAAVEPAACGSEMSGRYVFGTGRACISLFESSLVAEAEGL